MNDPLHHQLLGHLLGALDDDEQRNADARLRCDPQYRRLWRQWRRRLIPLDAVRPDFEPPPGLAERTCRYVAAFGFEDATSSSRPCFSGQMTPRPGPPIGRSHTGLLDVMTLSTVVLLVVALILPALNDRRFNARVMACQNNMRQFGLALSQYSHDQMNNLEDLAANGRLTRAGEHAAWLLQAGEPEIASTDVWLAIPGVTQGTADPKQSVPQSPSEDAHPWIAQNNEPNDPSYDGIDDDRPVETSPLLADVPGADLSSQPIVVHDGQGRNAMFEDGHVHFLPRQPAAEPTLTVPVILVGLQR